jgi:dihydrofolate synthase/folylpolyglutamate synthase
MPSSELEKIASSIFGVDRVFEINDLVTALDRAVNDAHRPLSEDTIGIIVTGSVVTVGEARTYLRKKFSQ